MEFPALGKHCDDPKCQQLDFLPIKCECDKVFCFQHYKEHLQLCDVHRASDVRVEELKKIENLFICSEAGCKKTSLVPLICEKCQKHYCINHRHIINCNKLDNTVKESRSKSEDSARKFQEAKLLIDKQLDQSLINAQRKSKNTEMARKIQLMRIKNKAVGNGSIPSEDRIYFGVSLGKHLQQLSSKTTEYYVYVSRNWSLGKSIDNIAETIKIFHNQKQDKSRALCLFRNYDDCRSISNDLSINMDDLLLQKLLTNGECLIFDYL